MTDHHRPAMVLAWELTRSCPLACCHCRASAQSQADPGELSTAECQRVSTSLAAWGPCLVILTGGEPLLRPDWEVIARAVVAAGHRVVLATCGSLVDDAMAARLVQAGVSACSISLDGPDAERHDAFRQVPGAFAASLEGIAALRRQHLPFQINTTVTRLNVGLLPDMLRCAVDLGASTWDCFFLVPTGRGIGIADQALDGDQQEAALGAIARLADQAPIRVKTTCAPRIVRHPEALRHGPGRLGSGCLAGHGFLFLSHTGHVQPCGFLDVSCGDVREHDLDLPATCAASSVLLALADRDRLTGSCGACAWRQACGGCRARALAVHGDFLAQEPGCPIADL